MKSVVREYPSMLHQLTLVVGEDYIVSKVEAPASYSVEVGVSAPYNRHYMYVEDHATSPRWIAKKS